MASANRHYDTDPLCPTHHRGKNGVIVDGHNRYQICDAHGVPFRVQERHFDSIEHAQIWMIANQQGRRHCPDYYRAKLALCKKDLLALIGMKNQHGPVNTGANAVLTILSKAENGRGTQAGRLPILALEAASRSRDPCYLPLHVAELGGKRE